MGSELDCPLVVRLSTLQRLELQATMAALQTILLSGFAAFVGFACGEPLIV